MKSSFRLLVVLLAGAGLGWFAGRRLADGVHRHPPSSTEARRVKFYQSPMHPWIRSDQPGRCTICGMALTPVYEGEDGLSASPGTVTLGTNSVHVLHVATTAAARRALTRTLALAGTIDDDDTRHRVLAAYVDGRVEKLHVNQPGQEVRTGEPLASFYSPALLAAEREYAALASRPSGDSTGPSTLLDSSRRRLLQMGLAEAQIRALPDKPATSFVSELLAPADGTVVLKRVYEGQYVKEGEPLFELADFSTMWVRLVAYETDLAWIAPGAEAEVTTPSLPGAVFRGRVSYIDPNFDAATRSTIVRVEIPNPQVIADGKATRRIRHRVTAGARIAAASPIVLAIPRTALLRGADGPVAYVDLGGGAYERRRITTGRVGDDLVEVIGGISEGEAVVTRGGFLIDSQARIDDGAPREPSPAPQSAAVHELPESARAAVKAFLGLADRLGTALASDDTAAFRREAASYGPVSDVLVSATSGIAGWQGLTSKIPGAPAAGDVADLRAARKWFRGLGEASVAAARLARASDPGIGVRLYHCPMTDRAFPGAPKHAVWVQVSPPLRNPYFGTGMPDCGEELRYSP